MTRGHQEKEHEEWETLSVGGRDWREEKVCKMLLLGVRDHLEHKSSTIKSWCRFVDHKNTTWHLGRKKQILLRVKESHNLFQFINLWQILNVQHWIQVAPFPRRRSSRIYGYWQANGLFGVTEWTLSVLAPVSCRNIFCQSRKTTKQMTLHHRFQPPTHNAVWIRVSGGWGGKESMVVAMIMIITGGQ